MSLSIANLPTRKYIPILLKEMGLNGLGVELGVAKANYSEILLENSNLKTLYGVDAWCHKRHTIKEYYKVKKKAKKWKGRFVVIRKSFDEAVELFKDEIFDFIFVDGFARKGQIKGHTMKQWWPKLKIGGIMAIHDYTPRFPVNVKAIKGFARKYKLTGYLTTQESKRTWMTIKQ